MKTAPGTNGTESAHVGGSAVDQPAPDTNGATGAIFTGGNGLTSATRA